MNFLFGNPERPSHRKALIGGQRVSIATDPNLNLSHPIMQDRCLVGATPFDTIEAAETALRASLEKVVLRSDEDSIRLHALNCPELLNDRNGDANYSGSTLISAFYEP